VQKKMAFGNQGDTIFGIGEIPNALWEREKMLQKRKRAFR
jgi:hypothetical protein